MKPCVSLPSFSRIPPWSYDTSGWGNIIPRSSEYILFSQLSSVCTTPWVLGHRCCHHFHPWFVFVNYGYHNLKEVFNETKALTSSACFFCFVLKKHKRHKLIVFLVIWDVELESSLWVQIDAKKKKRYTIWIKALSHTRSFLNSSVFSHRFIKSSTCL